MSKMPLVSVIVPVYNCEPYLDRCIESIISQSFKDIEIILVDDGSTDESLLKCKKYAKRDDRVIVLHQENQGVSSARNKGIEQSSGCYICFVDGDDSIDDGYIEELVARQQEKPEYIVRQGYRTVSGKDIFFKSEPLRIKKGNLLEAITNGKTNGSSCGYLFESETIKSNGIKFNVSLEFLEDNAFVVEYLQKSSKTTVDIIGRGGGYVYYKNGNSKTNATDIARRVNGYLEALEYIDQISKQNTEIINKEKEQLILENVIGAKKASQLKEIRKVLKKHKIDLNNTLIGDIKEEKYNKVLFLLFVNRIKQKIKKLFRICPLFSKKTA